MIRRWRLPLAVAVTLALGLVTAAGAQSKADLAEAKAKVERIAAEIAQASNQAAAADAELADADARLAEVETIVNDIAVQLEQQSARVAEAEAELQRLRDEAATVQAAFEARIIEMFKYSFGGDLDMILSATDIESAIDRSTLLQAVNRSDQATLEQVEAAQGAVLTQQDVLAGEADRLEAMQAEQLVILEQVREIRESRALAAANARAEVVELEREKENLESDQKRIEELIRQRSAPPPTISSPSVSGYIWPVCGRVTSEYGRRWGRLHAGLDIDDNVTKAIVASKAGRVVFTGWSGGYGQLTLIDHGDGVVTAYAHQSDIIVAEGEQVSRGERIGTIGTTGSSTGTHLHFETRVNGSAVNPRQFLGGGC